MRENPRISINQLAKYLMADAPKRRRIILEQKQPSAFKVNYYDLAQQIIMKFLLAGANDEEIITAAIDKLYSTKPESDYDVTKLGVNIEALQAFLDSYENIRLDGLTLSQGSQDCPKITIEGVDISVRPEIFLHEGQNVTGAIKFYFGKNDPLTSEAGAYISSVVGTLVQQHYGESSAINSRRCQSFDVFTGEIFYAPKATTKRFRDIKYACQEIAMWWNRLDTEE